MRGRTKLEQDLPTSEKSAPPSAPPPAPVPAPGRGGSAAPLFAVLLYAAVFGVLFAPVLSGRETVVHGDGVSVSLPLQHLLATSLERGAVPLWSSDLYGGHPIFAEGQGAFAHPLNLLLFGLVPALLPAPERTPSQPVASTTIYLHGLFHVVCGLVAALGTFGLCRTLGLGPFASLVAGLALATSQDWLGQTSNAAIAGSTAWAPVVLLGVERWWRRPDLQRAAWLALAIAAMALAGYPQALHGTAIFALLSLLVRVDRAWLRHPGRHLGTGLVAIALAAGLSAVQLLPTLELVGDSVRAGGVEVAAAASPLMQLRGLLFSIGKRAAVDPGLGSVLLFGLALASLQRSRLVLSYWLPTLVLFQLSLADRSPLYRAARDLLPGLDRFRITHLYTTIGLVGLSVLAGIGLQRLSEWEPGSWWRRRGPRVVAAGLGWIAVAVALVLACAALDDPELVSRWTFVFPGVAAAAAAALLAARRGRWIPGLLLLVVLAEIVVLRRPLHDFVDVGVVREPPPTARYLRARRDERGASPGFKLANVPHFFSYVGFASASTPGLERLTGLFLSSLDAGSNLLWSIPSINANLALPLARRRAVEPLIAAEIRGESARAPGRRFVDREAIRYVVIHRQHRKQPFSPELREVFVDEDYRFHVLENPAARDPVDFVPATQVAWVDGPRAAVALLERGDGALLVLEEPASGPPPGMPSPSGAAGGRAAIAAVQRPDAGYEIEIDVDEPGYLVVADSPYRGWQARVDGVPAPVLAADVLCKAVPLAPGAHRVTLSFEPRSVRVGLGISLASAGLLAILLVGTRWRARRG